MKKAFTLSEVLITLTIIGVVAALTIPSLNNHVGEADKIAKIKKVQAILGDMLVLSEIANGPMENWPVNENVGNMKTKFWPKYIKPFFNSTKLCNNMTDCGYGPNFKASKWQDANWGLSTGSTRVLFQLMDGTVIFWPLNTTDAQGRPAYVNKIYVDINGPKNPNTFCKDVFTFAKDYDQGTISATGCTLEYITEK